jgi:REP element-mobilizing transposase RayT
MTTVCQNTGNPVHQIGGVKDHVHMFISLSKTETLSKLIAEIKANSSRWVKSQHPDLRDFSWQGGYGAFSLSRSDYHSVIHYIANQKEHHKTVSFQDEFRKLMEENGINYDERYVWE